MQSHFRVEVHSEDRATVLAVSGELDLASSPALEEELERASGPGVDLLILDLRELEFMDSTGLSVVLKASQRAQDAGQRFGLVQGSQQVRRLLNLTGVAARITLVDSPEELLGGA